jgi:hypothetical protein
MFINEKMNYSLDESKQSWWPLNPSRIALKLRMYRLVQKEKGAPVVVPVFHPRIHLEDGQLHPQQQQKR